MISFTLIGAQLHIESGSESADESNATADIEAERCCHWRVAVIRKFLEVNNPSSTSIAEANNLDFEGDRSVAVRCCGIASTLKQQQICHTFKAELIAIECGCYIPSFGRNAGPN
eukprot:CAMPEP_0115305156 /NCGR_PEP_ID=MMETSP0270-20121206/71869_1 /TAXON_ID=71861 /ORGANISM="Scrippsiella trochoidea, Strain CCMP3099" /LENGTH=113 /DNA_ID=CAMNT_0002723337 /DNA_START=283 /DNA_END=624 /DNA_ORIENTATION=-